MHPILFDIFGFEIHSYGAFGAAGFLLTSFSVIVRGRKIGIPSERMADLIFWSAVFSLLGARVVFILQNPGVFTHWTEWVNLRTGGMVFYGSVLFGIPAGSALMARLGMPLFATWDMFAAAFPIAHGISRVGCFLAGCCYGSPYDGPGSVVYSHPRSSAPLDTPVHPVQLYEAGFLFALGIALQFLYARKRYHGQVMLAYLVAYAIGRSVVEVYRGDASRGWFMPELLGETFTYSQGFSVVLALFAVVVFGVLAPRAPSNQIKGPVAP